ncbi:MAG: DUF3991 domain-containing protein [Gammaproteobacteria bacterium]|nr:DUF3991 domain-containing protein [Gammaproteobacteria bacterium]
MNSRTDEINQFKSEINLSEYAASVGYCIDRKESSTRSVVMRSGDDKIAIARAANNHYIYYSFRDETNNGTIIDFVQKRKHANLGQVRQELRPWVGTARPYTPHTHYSKSIVTTSKDRQGVLKEFAKQIEIDGHHDYLNTERLIPTSVVLSDRFKGRVYSDDKKNAVFPHYDSDGLCGFEKKNVGYTGFSKGGDKTVWISNCYKTDTKLMIVESGIEALSYDALYGDGKTRYLSVSGTWSEEVVRMVKKTIKAFEGEIVLGFNNDKAGHQLEERMRGAIGEDWNLLRAVYPVCDGEDWNDELRRRHQNDR